MPPFARPLLFACVLIGSLLPATAQNPAIAQGSLAPHPQANRIAAHPNLRAITRLAGHVPTWANAVNDAGPVSADTTLRLTFVLSRSAERQAAFEQLLADQQNPASPHYHHWLTPQQVGSLYGPTQDDLATLTDWLSSQGLAVMEAAPSGVFLTVQAPASTVANALGTSFHNFNLRESTTGGTTPHLAATTNPAIPTAFAAVVTSIHGLADNPIVPDHYMQASPASMDVSPDHANLTAGSAHYLTPGDFAVIYGINPVYQSGINGAGQKVAIIGRSRVLPADITNLQSLVGLANNTPNTIVPPSGADPGMTGDVNQEEATLDVDRVLGTAPGAQADLIVSTAASGGIETAAQYNVQTVLDPVMTISFSSCEATAGSSFTGFWDSLFLQAAAEGISSFVSSGDSGAAECQTAGQPPTQPQARSINAICASSYVTCVGGTEFADLASPSPYWNPTTAQLSNSATLVSALSYIPEGAWNDPGVSAPFIVLGTGGGASTFISKPVWQTGVGVPNDGFRDIPDVSFASSGREGYIFCFLQYDCSMPTANRIIIAVAGGTSAAAPAMAGIAALLNQKTGGAQGNLNPLLYRLAASNPAAFHDATPVTSGIACDISTSSTCNNSTPSATALTGGLAGYALTAGYDQATGLGSLNVASFLTAFANDASISASPASSSLTLIAGATTGNTSVLTLNSSIYVGSVTLGCTVTFNGSGTANSLPGCSLSPSTVTLAANGSATSTLTLTTKMATTSQASGTMPPASSSVGRIAFGLLFLLLLLPARRYRRSLRTWQSLPAIFLLLLGFGALSGCSGNSPSAPPPVQTIPGTTTGAYTVTVNATTPGGPSTSTSIALTVN